MEDAKRRRPYGEVLRQLFALSGNLCAFEGCDHVMVDSQGAFVGQVCHIEAAEAGGERFRATMTNDERRSFENLMLMCYAHHVETNDVGQYPTERMHDIKASHEVRFAHPEDIIARSFRDIAVAQAIVPGRTLQRFAEILGWDQLDDETREGTLRALEVFAERLRMVSKAERELLCILARREKHGKVYLSELIAITGQDSEIAHSMELLSKYRLVKISEDWDREGNPMYEARDFDGWDVLQDLMQFCETAHVRLESVLVELRFDLVD